MRDLHFDRLRVESRRRLVDDQQRVRDDKGEERLFVEPRVRVDHQDVETQLVDELAQPLGQELSVVALAQHARNFSWFDARREKEELTADQGGTMRRDVTGSLLDRSPVPEEVVERGGDLLASETEEDVDPG